MSAGALKINSKAQASCKTEHYILLQMVSFICKSPWTLSALINEICPLLECRGKREIKEAVIALFFSDNNQGRKSKQRQKAWCDILTCWSQALISHGSHEESWEHITSKKGLCWIPFAANGLDGACSDRQSQKVNKLCRVIFQLFPKSKSTAPEAP